jgi:fumarate reductase (CoM/CoB) subunit A
MERSTRAMLNRAVAMEIFEGRGSENNAVYVDIRHVFDEANAGASADVIKTFKNSGVDLKTSFLEVTSCPHTYLGGLRIDEWGRTTVGGLYAGGEAAGGIHGANRLGGAALIDSYVFGYRAGMTAACESRAHVPSHSNSDNWRQPLAATSKWINRSGAGMSQSEWRAAVQELVVTSAGQVRRGDRLESALAALDELDGKFADVRIEGETPRQRFDCARRCLETRNLIQVARMLGTAALLREESRGGHFRLDFPATDERRFRRNIVVWNQQGNVRAELRDVPDDRVAGEPPPGIVSTEATSAETV